MADYWKSTQKEWCEYCKSWVYPNPVSRKKHYEGKKHKENVEKKFQQLNLEKEAKTATVPNKPANYDLEREKKKRQEQEEEERKERSQMRAPPPQIPKHILEKMAEGESPHTNTYNKNQFKALQSIIQNNHATNQQEEEEEEATGPMLPDQIERQQRIEKQETWEKSRPPSEWGDSLIAPWSTVEDEAEPEDLQDEEETYSESASQWKEQNTKKPAVASDHTHPPAETFVHEYEYGIEMGESESKKLQRIFETEDDVLTKKPIKSSLLSQCGLDDETVEGEEEVIIKKRKVSKTRRKAD